MRLSKALNDNGTPITRAANNIPGVVTERVGTKYYIVRVNGGRQYLLNQWGLDANKGDVNMNKVAGQPFVPANDARFKGKTGIVAFKIDTFSDASGHIDIFNGSQFSHEMPNGWDGADTNPHEYWRLASNIMFWRLTDPGGSRPPSPSPGGGSGGSGGGNDDGGVA